MEFFSAPNMFSFSHLFNSSLGTDGVFLEELFDFISLLHRRESVIALNQSHQEHAAVALVQELELGDEELPCQLAAGGVSSDGSNDEGRVLDRK